MDYLNKTIKEQKEEEQNEGVEKKGFFSTFTSIFKGNDKPQKSSSSSTSSSAQS